MVYSWQSSQWQSLTERIEQDRLPHALLFQGAQGIGKVDFINSLIARIFCSNVHENKACGQCDNCHLLNVNNHPDLRIVECEEGKKNISVDQIRDIIEYASFTPHSAKYKIAVVHQAELMSVNAANSLLKTLEEPPKSALIFLSTHKPEQLLPTILSRCQKVSFKMPSIEEADTWLAQEVSDESRRKGLLALSNGAPLKALDYERQGLIESRQQQFDSLLALVSGKQDPVSTAEAWLKLDLELSLYSMLSWVVDLCRLKSIENAPYIVNLDLQTRLEGLNQKTDLNKLLHFHQFLNECVVLARTNVNTQLLIEDILIRWVKVFR